MIGKHEVITEETIGALVTEDHGHVLQQVQTEIGLDVFECQEYNHFTRDCLTTKQTER